MFVRSPGFFPPNCALTPPGTFDPAAVAAQVATMGYQPFVFFWYRVSAWRLAIEVQFSGGGADSLSLTFAADPPAASNPLGANPALIQSYPLNEAAPLLRPQLACQFDSVSADAQYPATLPFTILGTPGYNGYCIITPAYELAPPNTVDGGGNFPAYAFSNFFLGGGQCSGDDVIWFADNTGLTTLPTITWSAPGSLQITTPITGVYNASLGVQSASGTATLTPAAYWPYTSPDGSVSVYDAASGAILIDPHFEF